MSDDKFIITDETINIDDIMKKIRENIIERNKLIDNLTDLPYSKLSMKKANYLYVKDSIILKQNINDANRLWAISAEQNIVSDRKIIGRIIVFIKKAIRKSLKWLINPIVMQQKEFNASVTRSLNEISSILSPIINNQMHIISELSEKLSLLKDYINDLDENTNKYNSLANEVKNFDERLKDLDIDKKISMIKTEIQQLESKCNSSILELENKYNDGISQLENKYMEMIDENIRDLNNKYESFSAFAKNLFTVEENVRNLNTITNDLVENYKYIKGRIKISESHEISNVNDVENLKSYNETNSKDINDFSYFLFEQKFRGSREEIKNRQRIYLDYFKSGDTVLDVGCGRGEFLELLKENNIKCHGIDINDDMVYYCKDLNLSVEKYDVFSYVSKLNDNTLDGIFMAQVIEHIEFGNILKLLELFYKKLNSGGRLIIETINAHTLSALAKSYFLDISHINPVDYRLLEFIMEDIGFQNIEVKLLSQCKEHREIQPEDKLNEGLAKNINDLNDTIFGYQDYAIIGYK